MKYELINYGFFYADGGAMFGAVPKRAWKRRYASDEQNRCLLAIRGLLVRVGARVVLVDCGVGQKPDKRLSYYQWKENLPIDEVFSTVGVTPDEVTDVILTHLHFDHCGGATYRDSQGEVVPQFPNAVHWTSRRHWEHAMNPSLLEADSFFRENVEVLLRQQLIRFVDGDTSIGDGITLYECDGHTVGQLAPLFVGEEGAVLFPGDVIPIAAHHSAVWISAYDIEPLKSLQSKQRLLDVARETNATLVYCHDAYKPESKL